MAGSPSFGTNAVIINLSTNTWGTLIPAFVLQPVQGVGIHKRQWVGGTIYNADTVAATVQIRYNDGAATYLMHSITLDVGDTLVFVDADDGVDLPSTAHLIQIRLTAAITTNALPVVMSYQDWEA